MLLRQEIFRFFNRFAALVMNEYNELKYLITPLRFGEGQGRGY